MEHARGQFTATQQAEKEREEVARLQRAERRSFERVAVAIAVLGIIAVLVTAWHGGWHAVWTRGWWRW